MRKIELSQYDLELVVNALIARGCKDATPLPSWAQKDVDNLYKRLDEIADEKRGVLDD